MRLSWPVLILAFLALSIWKLYLGDGMRGHELDDTQVGLLLFGCAFCTVAAFWVGVQAGRSDPNRS